MNGSGSSTVFVEGRIDLAGEMCDGCVVCSLLFLAFHIKVDMIAAVTHSVSIVCMRYASLQTLRVVLAAACKKT